MFSKEFNEFGELVVTLMTKHLGNEGVSLLFWLVISFTNPWYIKSLWDDFVQLITSTPIIPLTPEICWLVMGSTTILFFIKLLFRVYFPSQVFLYHVILLCYFLWLLLRWFIFYSVMPTLFSFVGLFFIVCGLLWNVYNLYRLLCPKEVPANINGSLREPTVRESFMVDALVYAEVDAWIYSQVRDQYPRFSRFLREKLLLGHWLILLVMLQGQCFYFYGGSSKLIGFVIIFVMWSNAMFAWPSAMFTSDLTESNPNWYVERFDAAEERISKEMGFFYFRPSVRVEGGGEGFDAGDFQSSNVNKSKFGQRITGPLKGGFKRLETHIKANGAAYAVLTIFVPFTCYVGSFCLDTWTSINKNKRIAAQEVRSAAQDARSAAQDARSAAQDARNEAEHQQKMAHNAALYDEQMRKLRNSSSSFGWTRSK